MYKKIKDEQIKKEEAIYDQWKGGFTVGDQGEELSDLNDENLINDFINYIKLRKVVPLEDLSGEFKLSNNVSHLYLNQDLLDRLRELENQGRICGIIDDRGKYIFLSEKELTVRIIKCNVVQLIEKLFVNRGRISKSDLIKECNKLIRFVPTDEVIPIF